MVSNVVSYPVIVNGDTQWISHVYYSKDTNELEYVCIQDPTNELFLSAHSNEKHVFLNNNCGLWESWYPYFLNSDNTRFIIKNCAHNTFIIPDEDDDATFWQVWDKDNPESTDFNGMVVFEGTISLTYTPTNQTRDETIREIFGDDDNNEDVTVINPLHTPPVTNTEAPKPKRKYTKKADKVPKVVDPNKPKRKQPVGMKAFQAYAKAMRPMVKEENQGISLGDMQKMLGDMWKGLPDEEKQPYIDEVSGSETD